MIDKIDLKILAQLNKDANISNTRLAKTIGLNAATVAKRIDEMVSEGLIKIKAVPNSTKLGYKIKAVIVLKVDWINIDAIMVKLKENPNILLLVTTFGRFEILMIADFSEWEKLNEFVKEEINQCPGVKQTDVLFVDESKKMYRDIFRSGPNTGANTNLDDIDHKLIAGLCENGRASYTDLAVKMGTSQATISRRVSFLLKNNLIKIIAVPDPSKFGCSANAFILLKAEHNGVDKICAELNTYPQVYGSMTLSFGFDILLYVQFKNTGLLYEFVKTKISHIDGIYSVEILIVAEYLKTTYESVDFECEI